MLEDITIDNFKSIDKLRLSLGRVNIFIGENGSGKSNLLEAIALAAAAEAGKLDNEFLASRGIRVSSSKLMRSLFKAAKANEPIVINIKWTDGHSSRYELNNDNKPYSSWTCANKISLRNLPPESALDSLKRMIESIPTAEERMRVIDDALDQLREIVAAGETPEGAETSNRGLVPLSLTIQYKDKLHYGNSTTSFANFLIYSPENSALRTYEREGQIEPLGIYGEGLLRFLEVISTEEKSDTFEKLKLNLDLFSWYKDLRFKTTKSQNKINIADRYLDKRFSGFDQRSANEGFLFVTFYMALLTSELTPKIFAIDNVDTALNPKLCQELIKRMVAISKSHDKQMLLTTHNPACLDGLDLNDQEQRLFVVSRSSEGRTRVRRFERKESLDQPSRLSELFIRGALGGLPKGF